MPHICCLWHFGCYLKQLSTQIFSVNCPSGHSRRRCMFLSRNNLKKLAFSFAHQWILWSEWVPSEWESKILKNNHKQSTQTNLEVNLHQFPAKQKAARLEETNPSRHAFFLNSCFQLKYKSSSHGIAFYRNKLILDGLRVSTFSKCLFLVSYSFQNTQTKSRIYSCPHGYQKMWIPRYKIIFNPNG